MLFISWHFLVLELATSFSPGVHMHRRLYSAAHDMQGATDCSFSGWNRFLEATNRKLSYSRQHSLALEVWPGTEIAMCNILPCFPPSWVFHGTLINCWSSPGVLEITSAGSAGIVCGTMVPAASESDGCFFWHVQTCSLGISRTRVEPLPILVQ